MNKPTSQSSPRKSLEVSTSPAIMGGEAVAPNKSSLFRAGPVALVRSPESFIGKFVVFCPVGNQLSQPIKDRKEALAFALALKADGKPAVLMEVLDQFVP